MLNQQHLDILKQGVDIWNMHQEGNIEEIDLSGANLSGMSLSKANLYWADLSGSDLRGTNLSGANLSLALLMKADLRGTNLSGADVGGADMTEADLRGAILDGVDFNTTTLLGADLSGADLREKNFSLDEMIGLCNDMSGIKLNSADLSKAKFIKTILIKAVLRGANLSYAKLCGTDLSDADLSDANLTGVDLSGANLSGANLSNTNLTGANLSGANLNKAILSKKSLQGANLEDVDLSQIDFRRLDLSKIDLTKIVKVRLSQIISANSLINNDFIDLSERLSKCEPGREHWQDFEQICIEILTASFVPPLKEPKVQARTSSGSERRDALFPLLGAKDGWEEIGQRYNAFFLLCEFKNYATPIGKDEVNQVRNYLRTSIGRIGLLFSRKGYSEDALRLQNRIYAEEGKVILFFTDDHLIELLKLKEADVNPLELLRDALSDFYVSYE